jgi:hypothetical protein
VSDELVTEDGLRRRLAAVLALHETDVRPFRVAAFAYSEHACSCGWAVIVPEAEPVQRCPTARAAQGET